MKSNCVVLFAALVFLLVVVPVNIDRGFTTSWQNELLALGKSPPGEPAGEYQSLRVEGKNKDKDKGKDKNKGGASVPEPSTLILLGLGLAAGGAYSFSRRQKSKEQE